MVLGGSRDSPFGLEDEEDEEEKLLKQAIALSLEGTVEEDEQCKIYYTMIDIKISYPMQDE